MFFKNSNKLNVVFLTIFSTFSAAIMATGVKYLSEFLNPIMQRAQSVHTVAIVDEENSYTALDLVRLSGGYARPATSVKDAVANIVTDNNKPGRILICGSLYLAGKVLAENT